MTDSTVKTIRQLSCKDGGKFDHANRREPLGWHKICRDRANDNSRSQRRKRAREGQ